MSELPSEQREEMLTAYVLGDLSTQEAEEFERLLANNPALVDEVGRLKRALGLMPYAKVVEPPPHLRSAVLEAAQSLTARPAPRFNLRWSIALGAAAVLAIILGVQSYQLRQELQSQRDVMMALQQPNVLLLFSMKGTDKAPGAFGTVAMDLDDKRAAVAIQNLPGLSAGQVYRLWAVVANENIACGQFIVDSRGTVINQFAIPVDSYKAPISRLIVTLESTVISKRPTGPTVMVTS